MKEKVKKIIQFILNPRLLLCFVLAWMITNGWSYLMFGLGTYFKIHWMTALSGAYLAFLWLPVSPEKIVTFAISIALLRWLFPKDEKTLAVLKELYGKAKQAIQKKKPIHRSAKKKKTLSNAIKTIKTQEDCYEKKKKKIVGRNRGYSRNR